MTDDRWKYRRQGALFVLLFLVLGGAVWAWRESGQQAEIMSELEAATAAKALNLQLAKVNRDLQIEVGSRDVLLAGLREQLGTEAEKLADEVKVRSRVIARYERLVARLKREPAPEPSPDLPVPEPVVITEDCIVGQRTISGECRLEEWDVGGRPAARAWFSAEAQVQINDELLTLSDGPRLSDSLEFDLAPPEAPDEFEWRRRWWFGGVWTGAAWGPTAAVSLERRRWAAKAGVGVAYNRDGLSLVDADLFQRVSEVDPVLTLEFSRAGRAR